MGKKFGVRRIENCCWEREEEDTTQKVVTSSISNQKLRYEVNEHHCVSSGLLRSRNQDRIGYIGDLVEEILVKGIGTGAREGRGEP